MLTARFWGVRGSIPCPGPDTVVYGGNTSCLEIRADERLIIVDLGSGVRPLGYWLIENDLKKYGKIKAEIFVTHTHWDHIMGLPMFNPAYIAGTELHIRGPKTSQNESLKVVIENQLSHDYWPVRASQLAANIKYDKIEETTLDLGGGLTVTSKIINHTTLCLGYRFEYKNKSIVTIFDYEAFNTGNGKVDAEKENEKIRQFMKGADIVIHDAQYTQDEYADHAGWGHGSFEQALKAATGLDIKKLVFFHHDPSHTDKKLKQLEKKYANKSNPKTIMAKEGLLLEA
ncbi:MAG: MBL fold metallo-hydrolase [Treponema sp.]|jgi:phosphoribosyl 1,2-cyclic phosphodiesterase|nr:MBL fold metallo-hydrolase [Treponema sp.]